MPHAKVAKDANLIFDFGFWILDFAVNGFRGSGAQWLRSLTWGWVLVMFFC